MKYTEINLTYAKCSKGLLPPDGHVNPFEESFLDITGKDSWEWQKIIPVADKIYDVTLSGIIGTGVLDNFM